jgi:hypothetical protein
MYMDGCNLKVNISRDLQALVGRNLTEMQIIFWCISGKNLYRDTFHKYISVIAKQIAVFFMSLQTCCASGSAKIFAMCTSIIQHA